MGKNPSRVLQVFPKFVECHTIELHATDEETISNLQGNLSKK